MCLRRSRDCVVLRPLIFILLVAIRASVLKKTEFLDKSPKAIDILRVFFEPK